MRVILTCGFFRKKDFIILQSQRKFPVYEVSFYRSDRSLNPAAALALQHLQSSVVYLKNTSFSVSFHNVTRLR